VVDYLQRIQGDGRRNDLENITRNIRILDSLAEKLDVVCILISMANRDSEGGKIRMKHMKGSGEIEQDADVLIALQSNEQQIDSDIEDQDVEVLKNRHGRKGKIPMRFMKASSQYTEIGSEFR
jgi:replicative DNA helicase